MKISWNSITNSLWDRAIWLAVVFTKSQPHIEIALSLFSTFTRRQQSAPPYNFQKSPIFFKSHLDIIIIFNKRWYSCGGKCASGSADVVTLSLTEEKNVALLKRKRFKNVKKLLSMAVTNFNRSCQTIWK